ncbi:epoxyqueuosine reductase [bacterium]|nr:epoxyqueuosine reductase [bacterium]
MGNENDKNTQELKNFAIDKLDAALFGVAKIDDELWFHPDIEFLKKTMKYVVVIGYKLAYGITDTLVDGPNILYLAHYRQLNYILDRSETRIAQWLELRGYKAVPIPASQTVDWKEQLGHFSHRHAAVKSGLAFWGRNNLAITPEFGAHQRWASILTDMPLTSGKKLNMDCGDCTACIKSCPANAIGMTREEWDYEKCFAMLKSFGKRGISHYICGMCIKPCKGEPFGSI